MLNHLFITCWILVSGLLAMASVDLLAMPAKANTVTHVQSSISRHSVGYVLCISNRTATFRDYAVKPEDIDFSAYTSVVFSYALVNTEYMVDLYDPELDAEFLRRLIKHIKNNHAGIRVLVSVGGPTVGETVAKSMSSIIASEEYRNTFIKSTLELLQEFGADGIELFWGFPSTDNQEAFDAYANGLVALVKDMHFEFSGQYKLSAVIPEVTGVPPGVSWPLFLEKIAEIHAHVEFLTFMGYGFLINPHHRTSRIMPYNDIRNVDTAINIIKATGLPKHKIVLGVPFCGEVYTRAKPYKPIVYSPYSYSVFQKLPDAPCVTYRELVDHMNDKIEVPATRHFTDSISQTDVVAFNEDVWITYIGPTSMLKRVQYANRYYGLGGIAAFYVNGDDADHALSKAVIAGMRE